MPVRHPTDAHPEPARAGARGFTLIELMIAVAVLGLLVSIALPKYLRYRKHARVAEAVHDIGMMSAVITNYWIDHRGYPASLADVGLDTALDPWGQPYAYYNVAANGQGGARKDRALRPLNADYDLYSLGPNGKSTPEISSWNSADDIIRAAGGSYVGLASGL